MRRTALGWFSLAIALAAPAGARISLPDAVVYGVVRQQGGAVIPADSIIRFVPAPDGVPDDTAARVLARATVGQVLEGSTPLYVARIALEQPASLDAQREDGRVRVGDRVAALWEGGGANGSDVLLGLVQIPAQGAAVRRNFNVSPNGDPGEPTPDDLDGDAIPNAFDNCARSVNGLQADANGDGIGDACQDDTRSNPKAKSRSIGNPGNQADNDTGFGAVAYVYEVWEREVTNAQYAEFLRAVATEDDSANLFNDMMASSPEGGIVRTGLPGQIDYVVKPSMGAKPVNFVSWLDAARYANWVENGARKGAIGPTTTEAGAFDLTGADPETSAVVDEEAESSLPTEDEWYKAAYYIPDFPEQGSAYGYRNYPTGSDVAPTAALADAIGDVTNAGANVANYESAAEWNGAIGNVVTAGDGGATSLFGLSDMGGNVTEWLAVPSEDGKRIVRGGSFESSHDALERHAGIAQRGDLQLDPGYEGPDVGLRLVPEPESIESALAVALVLFLLAIATSRSGATQ